MIKLNRCPFCGASARIISGTGDGTVLINVDCPACGARGPRGMDAADAVQKWNLCVPVDEGIKELAPDDLPQPVRNPDG